MIWYIYRSTVQINIIIVAIPHLRMYFVLLPSGTVDLNAPQFKFFIALTTAYWLTSLGTKYMDVIDRQVK
jgi:hypothetical protein